MAKTLNAECPTCKTPLPVVVDKQSVVRVAICNKCGDEFEYEFEYSAWVSFTRKSRTFTKIELEKIASGHHVRLLVEGSWTNAVGSTVEDEETGESNCPRNTRRGQPCQCPDCL